MHAVGYGCGVPGKGIGRGGVLCAEVSAVKLKLNAHDTDVVGSRSGNDHCCASYRCPVRRGCDGDGRWNNIWRRGHNHIGIGTFLSASTHCSNDIVVGLVVLGSGVGEGCRRYRRRPVKRGCGENPGLGGTVDIVADEERF